MMRTVLCGSGGDRLVAPAPGALRTRLGGHVDELEVLWPSGARQVVDDVAVDQMVSIEEGAERCLGSGTDRT